MKFNVSNTNAPIWRDVTVHAELPAKLKNLDELSRNVWWSWNSEAKRLFHDIDADLWRATGENPVMLLHRVNLDRYNELANDKAYLARLDAVYKEFKEYMSKPFRKDVPSISYFSMEYGLCSALKIYSGGLGVLAGDYIKEASDSCVDLTAVGFLYRYGYFDQTLSMEGQQIAEYHTQDFNQIPVEPVLNADGTPMLLEVPYPGRIVYCNVWRVNVGRVKLYLLDSDNKLNSEFDRFITHQLYGGDWENRIKQEYLLGIGGVIMLRALGINTQLYHCNEGHAALLNLQRLVEYVQNEKLPFEVALEMVKATGLYTVHTPVPAGHDYFEESLFGKYMGEFPAKLGISWSDLMNMGRENPDTNERFSMSVFALNTCQESNGVSWLHGEVSKRMFQGVWKGYAPEESHVSYVTNGVHMPTWAASEWKEYYAKTFGPDYMNKQSEEATWAPILKAKEEDIWNIRVALKHKFINYVKREFKETWLKNQGDPSSIMTIIDKINPNALIIGFARRFATYKRAHLLFTDLDRLAKIVNNEKFPVQFVFAGKAHPADGAGQDLIKNIVRISRMPQFLGKIIFLENYDMTLAKRLVSGVDIWLNTPTRPLEASGTSGEKAEMNGVLNFSVLDGWWYEGYREGAGWALTDKRTFTDQGQQDQLDAATIYSMLENEIIPLYFAKNSKGYSPEWIQYIKNSIAHIAPNYTMKRMIDDYINRFYAKEGAYAATLKENNYAKAKELVAWKENFVAHWDGVQVVEFSPMDSSINAFGDRYRLTAKINTNGLADSIGVEAVAYKVSEGNKTYHNRYQFKEVAREGDIVTYEFDHEIANSGQFQFGFRIYPKNENLAHRQSFAYMKWF